MRRLFLSGIARKEEIAKLAHGEDFDLFDRDATAFFDEGTKENPIVILSNEPTRIVGCSLEVSALRVCAAAAAQHAVVSMA